MKTEWDYTSLAKAYLKRPAYAPNAIDQLLSIAGVEKGQHACDVGAGVAHLTLELARHGIDVCAVEPNDEMRKYGIVRTHQLSNIRWFEGIGENTEQPDSAFDIVTFGSSFNVTDRSKALLECKRILKPGGWFACMWNHRDLENPIQKEIESIISQSIKGYNYGTRREDQTDVIMQSGLFDKVHFIEGTIEHTQTVEEIVEAWRSHGTLSRQAGDKFDEIINKIESFLLTLNSNEVIVPYQTRIWAAKLS